MINLAFLYYIETITNKIYNCFSFYLYAMVASGCSCVLKKVLVTDQLELGKTKTRSQFLIFLILYLYC